MLETVLFYVFATIAVVSAILVISRHNVVHSAIFLAATLLAVAGIFLTLHAEFLAGVQVIVYVGGILVLFVFVIMLIAVSRSESERQFNRKWNSAAEFEPFVPQPPTVPVYLSPVNASTVGQSVMLSWEGGRWAHKYDVYFGTRENNLSLIASDLITGAFGADSAESYVVSGLQNGASYCWRVVGKTMANQTAGGATWCFTASSAASVPSVPMQLLLDSTGPAVDQVASVDSMQFVRDPFPIVNGADLLGQGSDRNTRVIVFVRNLQLVQGENALSIIVNLVDVNNQSFNVPAEAVRGVPNTDFLQVIFRLPTTIAPGRCAVTIKAHSQTSNTGSIRVVPAT
jgi:hypothetical protein